MNQNNTSSHSYKVVTPLSVIMAFIGLTEIMAGIALINTEGTTQLILAIYLLIFPMIIACAYFYILFNKPYVLYSPFEYKSADEIDRFINTLRNTTDDAINSYKEIEKLRIDTGNQAKAISAITADGERMIDDIASLRTKMEKQSEEFTKQLENHKKDMGAKMAATALSF